MAFTPVQFKKTPLTDTLARPDELPDIERFTLGSYNVWNLFGEQPDPGKRPSEPASEEQLKALGKMIRSLDADVIAFQEVQNERMLTQLFREYVNPKIDDPDFRFNSFVCIPSNDQRGINVALATRFAVRGCLSFQDREFGPLDENAVRFSRDLLGVEMFATKKYRFLLFVAHLKAKIGGEVAAEKRRREAAEVRQILERPQFGNGEPFIKQDMLLCGDMNDDPDQEVIGILKGEGDVAMRDILEGLISYPTHNRYKKTRLDYIFCPSSVKVDEAKVHDEDRELAAQASDHFPVSVKVFVK